MPISPDGRRTSRGKIPVAMRGNDGSLRVQGDPYLRLAMHVLISAISSIRQDKPDKLSALLFLQKGVGLGIEPPLVKNPMVFHDLVSQAGLARVDDFPNLTLAAIEEWVTKFALPGGRKAERRQRSLTRVR